MWQRISSLPTFASLHNRDYRLLWLGQLGTSTGQWMDQVTRAWLIYDLTGSKLELGLVTAVRGAPLLLFGILAGVLADRSGRKQQLIVAQAVNAALNFMLATLVLTGHVHPWHLYVTGFFAGTVQAFQQPARQTLISDIVGNKQLMNALALNSAVLNVSRATGPALSGILFASRVGAEGSYYMQGALYLFATIWTIQMHVPQRSEDSLRVRREPVLQSTKEGLSYVMRNRNIRALMILALGPLALGYPYTNLMPIFARDVLHHGSTLGGLLLTCVGLGALGGAFFVATARRRYAYSWPVIAGAIAFGLALLAFSQSRWVPVSIVVMFIVGIFSVTYQTQDQTLAQLLAPPHLRGRVMSIYLLNRALLPMGTLLGGALAQWLNGPDALLIMSLGCIGTVLLTTLMHPGFIRLRVDMANPIAEQTPSEAMAPAQTPSG
ncbi:MAG: MFS transporter [Chloroflexi bacterium]|nr:MFS transporter [Chloroflexota bacterium]